MAASREQQQIVRRLLRRWRRLAERYWFGPGCPRRMIEGWLYLRLSGELIRQEGLRQPGAIRNHRDDELAERLWFATMSSYIDCLPARRREIAIKCLILEQTQRQAAAELHCSSREIREALHGRPGCEGLFCWFYRVYARVGLERVDQSS